MLAPFVWGSWALSVGYELLLGRGLPPAPYAAFETATSLLLVLSLLAGMAQAAVAYEVARRLRLARWWLRACLGAFLGLTAAAILFGGAVATLWHLTRPMVGLSGLVAALWVLLAAARGVAQGGERYTSLGLSFITENGLRLLGTALLLRPLGAEGALAAVAGSAAGALILTWRMNPPRWTDEPPLPPAQLGRIGVGTALGSWVPALPLLVLRPLWPTPAFAALTAMNLFLKGLAQVAVWFGLSLYPRLVADPARAQGTWTYAVIGAGAITLAAAGAGVLALPWLLHLVFAGRYLAELPAFRGFLPAAVPLAMYGLFVTRAMAREDGASLAVLTLGAVAWGGLFLWLHTGFAQVILDFAALGVLLAGEAWRLAAREGQPAPEGGRRPQALP